MHGLGFVFIKILLTLIKVYLQININYETNNYEEFIYNVYYNRYFYYNGGAGS